MGGSTADRTASSSPRAAAFPSAGPSTPKRPTSPLAREVSYPMSMSEATKTPPAGTSASAAMAPTVVTSAGPSNDVRPMKAGGNEDYYHEEPRAVNVPAAVSPTPPEAIQHADDVRYQ